MNGGKSAKIGNANAIGPETAPETRSNSRRSASRDSHAASETGRAGEEQVASSLSAKGWLILERNWRTRTGEIDIIAKDGDTLVFIEVKTWPHGEEADLEFVIGSSKQKRMVETAKCFLSTHRQYNGMFVRFDVILVSSNPLRNGCHQFRHLEDAFSERV